MDKDERKKIDIELYKNVFASSPVAFSLLYIERDDEGYKDAYFEYVNNSYENLFGMNSGTLQGKLYSEAALHKSQRWLDFHGDVAYGGKERTLVEIIAHSQKHVSIECYSIAPGYCICILIDITPQVETERQAHKNVRTKYEIERQRTFRDSSVISYAMFDIITGETVEIIDNSLPQNEKSNLSFDSFTKKVAKRIVVKSQREKFLKMGDRFLLSHCFYKGIDEQSMEYEYKLPDGKIIWVKSRFLTLREPNGSKIMLSYSCSDINKERTLEMMTSAIMEKFEILAYVNFVDDSTIMWYGKNSLKNKGLYEPMLKEEKYSAELELLVNSAIVPEEREEYRTNLFISRIKNELLYHSSFSFHLHVYGLGGEIRTKELQYFRYGENQDVCMFTQRDVTEELLKKEEEQRTLRDAYKKMQQANATQSDFLAKMSHELRTPLNVIIGSAELASAPDVTTESRNEYVDQINYSAKYLLSMFNDILDASRMKSGKFTLDNKWESPYAVLMPALSMMKAELKNKGINYFHEENYPLPENIEYFLDTVRCRQIATNLLNNALKFTPPGGTVSFLSRHLDRKADYALEQFIIKDTGCGMSNAFMDKMFEPFSQERNSMSSQTSGTGLGLSVVKQLLDSMNGTINVESEPGEGTCFTVEIPFYWRMRNKVEDTETLSENILNGKRILLVEDNEINAAIAKKLLEKKGMLVKHLKNGMESVNEMKLRGKHYDAVLMDIRMPMMDGWEATSMIRSLNSKIARAIPIIAMTANAYEQDIEKSNSVGMNAHLTKPIDSETMYETLGRLIDKSGDPK